MSVFRSNSKPRTPALAGGRGDKRQLVTPHSSPSLTPTHPPKPRPHCHLCDITGLEETVRQCPLNKSKLSEFSEHLIHSDCDVSERGEDNMTPLHLAIWKNDVPTTRVLLVFGADVNAVNDIDQTPLDMALQNFASSQNDDLVALLVSCGCYSAEYLPRPPPLPLPSPPPSLSLLPPSHSPLFSPKSVSAATHISMTSDPTPPQTPATLPRATRTLPPSPHTPHTPHTLSNERPSFEARTSEETLRLEMEREIERQLELSKSLEADEAMALVKQQKELARMNKRASSEKKPISPRGLSPWTTPTPLPVATTTTAAAAGYRVLSLDGGGVRGLIQIELLCLLERATGQRIRDLFDCFIGTSTGAIIALGIVYTDKSLLDLRRIYYTLKDNVFGRNRMGVAYNTSAMESVLKEQFGTETCMMEVTYPKILISAVNKSTVQPKLCFFNNFINDDYSTQPVWKVARYTSAAPLYFTECDNYVDGGLMANNPCDSGLTRLQQYHMSRGERLSLSCVVSLGSGISPSEPLGQVDAELNLRSILNLADNIRRTTNLIKLLSHALCESEETAKKVRSNCEAQGIPSFRFSPRLEMKIEPSETDLNKLFDMVIRTKTQMLSDPQLERLTCLLVQIMLDRRHSHQYKHI